jgi:hypothetical protein
MAVLTKSGITTGFTVDPQHITQIIDALTKSGSYDILISGSLELTGSVKSQNGFTGSLKGTASVAETATTSSYAQKAEVLEGSVVIPGIFSTTPAPIKTIGGIGKVLSGGTAFVLTATELTGKTLGVNVFPAISYSSSVDYANMKISVDSLNAGMLTFAYDKIGGGSAPSNIEFFYVINYT